MAQIMEETEKSSEVFPREPCDKKLLLGSLRDNQRDGVEMGCEKLIRPKRNNFGKVTLNVVFTILGDFPECRLYDLDDDGQYQFVKDPMTGEERIKVKVDNGKLATVFFPFYAVPKDKEGDLDENSLLIVTPGTSSYSLFKEALINAGELPKDMGNKSFTTCYAELKEALEGFEFIGKYAKAGTKNKFEYLLVERMDD